MAQLAITPINNAPQSEDWDLSDIVPSVQQPVDPYAEGWRSARELASFFASGGELPTSFAAGLVLQPGEGFLFQVEATYARLYGGDGSYDRAGTFVFGSAAVIGASLATTALVNRNRRNKAAMDAVASWREHQACSVVATTDRLLIGLQGVGFNPFPYTTIQEFHANPDDWSVVLGFPSVVPMRLAGPSSAYLGVHLAKVLYREQWQMVPFIQRLLG